MSSHNTLPDTPLISVITVSFNQGEFIKQNIESVLAQNYPAFEHIIVDGGSTDSTLDVLKSYTHLKWTSEPDRGQTHALNKGFARARGDIIAWLNSDDWFLPNIFQEISEKLKLHPIVMGGCQVTDKHGAPTELVPNIERNWFDILKYWIFFSSPAQPSIFFRRSILNDCKRTDGTYLDEELEYCMDYELWLRMTKQYPLAYRSSTVYSFYRNYDTNKTGKDMASVYREMSRVFRRHSNSISTAEHAFSIMLPVQKMEPSLLKTVESLTRQSFKDFEVHVVGYGCTPQEARALRREVLEIDRHVKSYSIRFSYTERPTFFEGVNRGFELSRSPLGAVLEAGTELEPSFVLESINLFSHDIIGCALPARGEQTLAQIFSKDDPQRVPGKLFNLQSLFLPTFCRAPFVYRTAAMLELGGFRSAENPLFAFREFLLRLMYKGWHINVDNVLNVPYSPSNFLAELESVRLFNDYITAELISRLTRELEQEPFGQLRAQNGFALVFPNDWQVAAQNLLCRAPAQWYALESEESAAQLSSVMGSFPNFSPGWKLLAENLQRSGDHSGSMQALKNFEMLREGERLFA